MRAAESDKEFERQTSFAPSEGQVRVLAALVLVFISNQACRALPFYLVDFNGGADPFKATNAALNFGSAEYGVLATLGFTVPFTLASLVAGVVSDNAQNRMRLLGIAGLAWSACTISMAFAGNYEVLLLQRGLLGLCQAATNPAAFSIIADLFPDARATANSIYGLGIYVGGGLASLGAALDDRVGWRSSFALFGIASAALSLLALATPDPKLDLSIKESFIENNGTADTTESCSTSAQLSLLGSAGKAAQGLPDAIGQVFKRTTEAAAAPAARWVLAASMLRFCAGFAILVWLPPAVRARFPGEVDSFAVYNSVIKAIVGGAASLAGGMATDAFRVRGFGDRSGAIFCAFSSILAAPLWYMVLNEGTLSFEMAMGFLLVQYSVAEGWIGPAVATLQSAAPVDRRGAAQGVFSALTALGNVLPAVLGLLSGDDLSRGLQVSVTLCYVLSGICFIVAATCLPKEDQL